MTDIQAEVNKRLVAGGHPEAVSRLGARAAGAKQLALMLVEVISLTHVQRVPCGMTWTHAGHH